MLHQEKQTNSSIAFNVDLRDNHHSHGSAGPAPKIKQRLEESAVKAAAGPSITLEQIAEKLRRAEIKRNKTLTTIHDQATEGERRRAAYLEKQKSIERTQTDQLKDKVQRELERATKKRHTVRETRQQKLRNHINKVEEIRKEQAVKRQTSCEHLKTELEHKLDLASQKRNQNLETKKTIAIKSAEKKSHAGAAHHSAPQWSICSMKVWCEPIVDSTVQTIYKCYKDDALTRLKTPR